jgi:hypothetical protein
MPLLDQADISAVFRAGAMAIYRVTSERMFSGCMGNGCGAGIISIVKPDTGHGCLPREFSITLKSSYWLLRILLIHGVFR